MKRSGFFFGKYAPENVLFPEMLRRAGVRTISAHAHGYFEQRRVRAGFDDYEIVPNLDFRNARTTNVTSPHSSSALRSSVRSRARREAVLRLAPLPRPPRQVRGARGIGPYGHKPRDLYDAEVTFTDQHIGKLLDFVARSHGARARPSSSPPTTARLRRARPVPHGFELWENLMRVPFLRRPRPGPPRIDSRAARSTRPDHPRAPGRRRDVTGDRRRHARPRGKASSPR